MGLVGGPREGGGAATGTGPVLLRLSPGGAVGATSGSGAAGIVVASFAASAGGCMRGITSVREEAGELPSVAVPHAMQRTAATTFKKSHDGQTTPRLLVNSAGIGGA